MTARTEFVPRGAWMRHLPLAGFVVVPALAVLLVRTALPGHGPAAANAAPPRENDATLILPEQAQPTAAQIELRAIMDREAQAAFGPSPVVMRRREAVEGTIDAATSIAESGGIVPPGVVLSAVMAAGEQAIAVIDGRIRRAGDSIAPGWTVAAIDRSAGTVTIRHASGAETILALRSRQP